MSLTNALPLYRQVAQFERIGISMSRATLASWMIRCGTLLTPLINLLREALHESGYIHMDETTLQVLKEPGLLSDLPNVCIPRKTCHPFHLKAPTNSA